MVPLINFFFINSIKRGHQVSQVLLQYTVHTLSLSLKLKMVQQGQGRGSAMLATVLVSLLVVQLEVAQAATYTVGGAGGWTFNVVGWTNGKQFKAGDVLVFKYSPAIHNVVAVNQAGYKACLTPRGAKVYKTGKDQIKLSKGPNFFICNFTGHCEGGMKIAVTAM
ncbi:hypothetical protein Ddye_002107 [Dipteronia dyeriana]|uniref:Basic blue protein n=1 Tax=Dipteronia dyeriana TaxID=168575 RepID=A0AAD9XR50_9ROSI|nr:hypothetical protein Ddye_002107 [Dipteronia dyeriana]